MTAVGIDPYAKYSDTLAAQTPAHYPPPQPVLGHRPPQPMMSQPHAYAMGPPPGYAMGQPPGHAMGQPPHYTMGQPQPMTMTAAMPTNPLAAALLPPQKACQNSKVAIAIQCPFCQAQGTTATHKKTGTHALYVACVCACLGCCYLIPKLWEGLKDTVHTCSSCNKEIGTHVPGKGWTVTKI